MEHIMLFSTLYVKLCCCFLWWGLSHTYSFNKADRHSLWTGYSFLIYHFTNILFYFSRHTIQTYTYPSHINVCMGFIQLIFILTVKDKLLVLYIFCSASFRLGQASISPICYTHALISVICILECKFFSAVCWNETIRFHNSNIVRVTRREVERRKEESSFHA